MIARIPFTTLVSVPFDDQRLLDPKSANVLDPSPGSTTHLTWGEITRGAVLCRVPNDDLDEIGRHDG